MKRIILALTLLPFLSSAQIVTTTAGTGAAMYSGDGGPATAATLNGPCQVTNDAAGNIYIADFKNNVVRRINSAGIISTIAGTGTAGFAGDGGPATAATLNRPAYVYIDATGSLLIADYNNNRVRKVNTSGIISTIAGTGVAGYSGDGGPATAAMFDRPQAVCTDVSGNIFVADPVNNRIRKVNTGGTVSTFAGNGVLGYGGDGGAATAAQLANPLGITFDAAGNFYIADQSNHRIRMINSAGIISTFAGSGTLGYSGDGGPATAAQFNIPSEVMYHAADTSFYVADQLNGVVRKINSTGVIATIAGTGSSGYSGDGGPAMLAKFNRPSGVCIDASGKMYIADQFNNRIRAITNCSNITTQPLHDTVLLGATAKYFVKSSRLSPTYQWQQNAGAGFTDLANAWPYSGVTTDTLTINNASTFINATYYRCIVPGTVCDDTSAAAILIVRPSTSIDNVSGNTINIFPNPAYDKLFIESRAFSTGSSVQITNSLGQLLINQKLLENTNSIDIQNLASGVYLIKVRSGEQLHYSKLIKN